MNLVKGPTKEERKYLTKEEREYLQSCLDKARIKYKQRVKKAGEEFKKAKEDIEEIKTLTTGRMVAITKKEEKEKQPDFIIRVEKVQPQEGFDNSFKLISVVGTEVIINDDYKLEIME